MGNRFSFFEKKVDSTTVFTGKLINVREDTVELVNGKLTGREIVDHPGGVTVLAVDTDKKVYMVRQYRYAVGGELIEAPAGKMEAGESPIQSAMRELSEETGLEAEQWIYFGMTYPSPGFSTETLHLFLALDLTKREEHPDEDEFLRVEKVSFDELVDMAKSGAIPDGKTINILFMAEKYFKDHNMF